MKKRVVIKLGGSSLQMPSTLTELAKLVTGLRQQHLEVIIVHGGGPAINKALTEKGIEWKFIDGQRQTTPQMMDVINRVLGHEINSLLVSSLQSAGIPAAGLSGAKHKILYCVPSIPELMQVGQIEQVDTSIVESVLAMPETPTPVISPIGIDRKLQKYNINADWAASQIAIALQAETLVFLTDQYGILDENKGLVSETNSQSIANMIDAGVISGGMLTKVRAMMKALNGGVKNVRVLHAGSASQLLKNEKAGTLLTQLVSQSQEQVTRGIAN